MQGRNAGLRVLLAVAVMAMVVMPVAIASGQGTGATASAGAGAKKSKALVKQVRKLTKLAQGLAKRLDALEAKGTPNVQIPATLPPSGPAGGDLSGSYPKPVIGPNAVTPAKIADNAVGASEIVDNAVGIGELADNSVDPNAIFNEAVNGAKVMNESLSGADIANGGLGAVEFHGAEKITTVIGVPGDGIARVTAAQCPDNSLLLAGGFDWEPAIGDVRVIRSVPLGNSWQVRGEKIGEPGANLIVFAYCLKA